MWAVLRMSIWNDNRNIIKFEILFAAETQSSRQRNFRNFTFLFTGAKQNFFYGRYFKRLRGAQTAVKWMRSILTEAAMKADITDHSLNHEWPSIFVSKHWMTLNLIGARKNYWSEWKINFLHRFTGRIDFFPPLKCQKSTYHWLSRFRLDFEPTLVKKMPKFWFYVLKKISDWELFCDMADRPDILKALW